MSVKFQIVKKITPNDVGETGSHQAGILIPRGRQEIIDFFPQLDSRQKNPRKQIMFVDANRKRWGFNFIYYNNKFFGGTRNEYRLTGMTRFFNHYNLKSDDEIIFIKGSNLGETYSIDFLKSGKTTKTTEKMEKNILKLNDKWRIIPL